MIRSYRNPPSNSRRTHQPAAYRHSDSHQQRGKAPILAPPCPLIFCVFDHSLEDVRWHLSMGLICILLVTADVQHLVIRVICESFLEQRSRAGIVSRALSHGSGTSSCTTTSAA